MRTTIKRLGFRKERVVCVLVARAGIAVFVTGCASSAGAASEEIAERATPAAIEQSIRTMHEEENRRLIVELLGSPEVEEASAQFIARVTDGALTALSEEERRARLREAADAFVSDTAESLGKAMHESITPEISRMIAQSVDATLQRALSDENQQKMADTAARITQTTMLAMMDSVRNEVGTSMRESLESEETERAVGRLMRAATKEIVLGMQDGFEEIDRRHERGKGKETLLTRMQTFASEGATVLMFASLLFAIATAALVVWLLRTRAQANAVAAKAKLAAAEAERREAALLALTEALKSTENQPWSRELFERIQGAISNDSHGSYFRDLLNRPTPSSDTSSASHADSFGAEKTGRFKKKVS